MDGVASPEHEGVWSSHQSSNANGASSDGHDIGSGPSAGGLDGHGVQGGLVGPAGQHGYSGSGLDMGSDPHHHHPHPQQFTPSPYAPHLMPHHPQHGGGMPGQPYSFQFPTPYHPYGPPPPLPGDHSHHPQHHPTSSPHMPQQQSAARHVQSIPPHLQHPSPHMGQTSPPVHQPGSTSTPPTAAATGRHRVTTTLWEDENTLCFQVDAKGVCVARRHDNNMINGTKLLNVCGMSRGKRDGILKNEKERVVVKVGAMHLKGVWITFQRAKQLSDQNSITDMLYPLFEPDIQSFLYHPDNYARTAAVVAAAAERQQARQQRSSATPQLNRASSGPNSNDGSGIAAQSWPNTPHAAANDVQQFAGPSNPSRQTSQSPALGSGEGDKLPHGNSLAQHSRHLQQHTPGGERRHSMPQSEPQPYHMGHDLSGHPYNLHPHGGHPLQNTPILGHDSHHPPSHGHSGVPYRLYDFVDVAVASGPNGGSNGQNNSGRPVPEVDPSITESLSGRKLSLEESEGSAGGPANGQHDVAPTDTKPQSSGKGSRKRGAPGSSPTKSDTPARVTKRNRTSIEDAIKAEVDKKTREDVDAASERVKGEAGESDTGVTDGAKVSWPSDNNIGAMGGSLSEDGSELNAPSTALTSPQVDDGTSSAAPLVASFSASGEPKEMSTIHPEDHFDSGEFLKDEPQTTEASELDLGSKAV